MEMISGGTFVGIGAMVVMVIGAMFMYQLVRYMKPIADKEEKYELFEEMSLDKVALKKGIDLEKELIKRNLFKKRTFRKEVEKEALETMFGKDK